MKIKHIVLSASILVSVSAMAQKDELKSLKKIYGRDEIKGNDLVEYKSLVTKVEPLATEEGDKIYAAFYKSMIPVLEYSALDKTMAPAQIQAAVAKFVSPKAITELANGLNATLDYEVKTGKKIYTDDINETITSFKPEMISYAITLGTNKMFKEAEQVLYAVYLLDKKDQDKLFYAASYAVNAQDYDKALEYYAQLKTLKYTGEGVVFWATNKASQSEETFATKEQRDLFIKAGTHEKPRDEKLESKTGEIYKNIALILVQQGKTEEAKAALEDAVKANPGDTSLVLNEADLYLKLKDYTSYTNIVKAVLEKEPNNAILVYNLGVITSEAGKLDEAEKYYRRSLEIDPNYFDANINLAELKLRADVKLQDEMSKLGTSEKDNKRYDQIRALLFKNYKEVLPYLEKAVEVKPKDEAANKTLLSVYNALEMTDKAKALKAKM
jgi:tetratricopeptide (TPR) repeat protein